MAPTGIMDAKDRPTVLAAASAAGTHICKLLVISKSWVPRPLRGVRIFPIHYCANKRKWIIIQIPLDWSKNHFVPEARAHCRSAGLDESAR